MRLVMLSLSFLCLLSIVPSLLAYPSGAPTQACGDLMPQHGAQSAPTNDGFFLLGDVFDGSYELGRTYEIQLVGRSSDFAGFFIQARAESNQDSVSSIVGVWTPGDMATTIQCNDDSRDSITHTSRDRKRDLMFSWTAPSVDVGRIHFLYSIVIAYTNIIVKLNATVERPSDIIAAPSEPPADAVFVNSYGQPEGCQRDKCDFYVDWRRNGEFIDFRMEGDGSGWIAMGITADNLTLNADRSFVDILACQTDSSSMVNVKDLYLPGNRSTNPLFDNSTSGIFYTSGRLESGRIFCNFTRVQFALVGQENEDANLGEENYIFFLSGTEIAAANETTAVRSSPPVFSSRTVNFNQGFVTFTDSFTSLPGKGSYPSSSCSREDCDFYFRWGVNPNNPNYLTIFINADLSQGWAAIGVSRDRRMGGDEIDDIFGCTTTANGTIFADTYNVAGGDRRNVGDNSGMVGIIPHSTGVVNGRIECTFSRVIPVLPGEEGSDFNLDNSYYIIIGTGEQQGAPFARHERNPEWSTSEVNLVRENSVDFDYARVPLIKTHGIFMMLAWPILAYLGISMARHMKPALPNGGWFQIHRILVLTSLFFTCLGFLLIFVAFHNNDTRGLITLGDVNRSGTAHFIIGILVLVLQFANPIIALFRCKPGSENRWIFNTFHAYVIGITLQILAIANVFIGLFLFGDKIANPQDMNAYWVFVALVSAFGLLDGTMSIYFGFSRYYCPEKTQPKKEVDQSETEMKKIDGSLSDSSSPPPPSKKTPSPDHWMRWAGWITQAVIVVCLGIVIIGLVGSG